MASRRLYDGAQIELGILPIVALAPSIQTELYYGVSGVWKQITLYYGVAGVWEQITLYYGVSGVWK